MTDRIADAKDVQKNAVEVRFESSDAVGLRAVIGDFTVRVRQMYESDSYEVILYFDGWTDDDSPIERVSICDGQGASHDLIAPAYQ
jgi:hypothetical protein